MNAGPWMQKPYTTSSAHTNVRDYEVVQCKHCKWYSNLKSNPQTHTATGSLHQMKVSNGGHFCTCVTLSC